MPLTGWWQYPTMISPALFKSVAKLLSYLSGTPRLIISGLLYLFQQKARSIPPIVSAVSTAIPPSPFTAVALACVPPLRYPISPIVRGDPSIQYTEYTSKYTDSPYNEGTLMELEGTGRVLSRESLEKPVDRFFLSLLLPQPTPNSL